MRLIRRVILVSAVLLLVTVTAVSCYYSQQIEDGAFRVEESDVGRQVTIRDIQGDRVTLDASEGDAWASGAVWGLRWEGGGYARVGAILSQTDDSVTRTFTLVSGTLSAGDRVTFDPSAYPVDPRTGRGIPFDVVDVPGEAGPLPAWLVPGDPERWVIVIHGKGSEQTEALRILPTLKDAGLTVLAVSYRNDRGVPGGSGRYGYGASEWPDIEAAARFAAERGAKDITLYGFSMGAGIALAFLENGAHAGLVRAAVFDSPVLDFGAIIDYQGERRSVPGPIIRLSKEMASLRFDIDWDRLDYLSRLGGLSIPVLVFHSRDDETIPYESSAALAADHPRLVTLVTYDSAPHAEAWNVDPGRYETAVRRFLTRSTE